MYNERPWTPKSIPLHEEEERLKCHAEGLTDSQAAVRCGIHHSTYHGWRKARGLSLNGDETKRGRAKKPPEKRSVLTADDIVHYHRNDNTPRETSNKIILKVDINPVLDLPEPTLKLADSPQGSRMGVVIGSKWDKNRELTVTAWQDTYANTVKRLVRNG